MPAIAVAAIQIGDQWDTLPATIAQTSADAKPKNVECSRNIVELILHPRTEGAGHPGVLTEASELLWRVWDSDSRRD